MKSFKIGNLEIKNRVVLAPMAGISDPTYIKICEGYGLGLAFTELISAEAIIRDNKKTFEMLKGIDKIKIPVGIQLFGSDPLVIAKAAKILVDLYNVKLIDINMGCPVPKVAIKNNSGSALLKDPLNVQKIVSSVVNSVDVPVTVKIRSGWDQFSINAVEIAKICEEAGASAISIHARTRSQGYSGKANWQIIRDVAKNVSIPVIGNGDIITCYDAKKMLDETGCTAIMIGRGLIGNPWLIKDCINYIEDDKKPELVSNMEKIEMIKYHLEQLCQDKNEKVAILEMRTHIMYYLKNMPHGKDLKIKIHQAKSKEEFLKLIDEYKIMITN